VHIELALLISEAPASFGIVASGAIASVQHLSKSGKANDDQDKQLHFSKPKKSFE
jgi:hypothetical protein